MPQIRREVMVVALVIGAPAMAIGIHDLQARLERWDHVRHVEA